MCKVMTVEMCQSISITAVSG